MLAKITAFLIFNIIFFPLQAKTDGTNPQAPFERGVYQLKTKGEPLKAIKKYCFDNNEEALAKNQILFRKFGRALLANESVEELTNDLSFRYDMEKTTKALLSFLHQYDIGEISASNLQQCADSVDALVNEIFGGNYRQIWIQYYKDIENKNDIAIRDSEEKLRNKKYKEAPEGRLEELYYDYAWIKKCHDLRVGYAVVYINDKQMNSAKSSVKYRENELIRKHPILHSKIDKIWSMAVDKIESNDYIKLVSIAGYDEDYKFLCQANYQKLVSKTSIRKDF